MKNAQLAHPVLILTALLLTGCSPNQGANEGTDSLSISSPKSSPIDSKAPERVRNSIQFSIQGFCDTPDVSAVLKAPSTLLARYDALLGKVTAGENKCIVALNPAEYCELSASFDFHTQSWTKLSQAFSDTTIFLQSADQNHMSVAQQLSSLVAGAAGEANDVLRLNLEDLRNNRAQNTNDPRLKTAPLEFREASRILGAMQWAGLADDTAEHYAQILANIAETLPALVDDTHLALTRAAVLAPKDREALMARNRELSVEIEASRQAFASMAKQTPHNINTDANAINPQAENSINMQAASACFSKLTLESSIVSEVSMVVKDELASLRAFDNCPTFTLKSSSLSDQIMQTKAMVEKDAKLFFAANKMVCN